ncbi:acyltransferase [Enterococcus larvae]|uniref:acyltransferase n=1 Tax=Enterococcus larvae TaxID=2794352 RepID=UPI003F3316DB
MNIKKAIPKVKGMVYGPFFGKAGRNLRIGSRVHFENKRNINLDTNVTIQTNAQLIVGGTQSISIGSNSKIGSYSIIKSDFQGTQTRFICGDNFGCGDFCFFGCAGGIIIGNDVIMGQNVRFHAQNHVFEDTTIPIRKQGTEELGIKVGNDCWIGAGAVILDGITIGNGCVIGANTLVNKIVPDNAIVVGNPMRIVGYR